MREKTGVFAAYSREMRAAEARREAEEVHISERGILNFLIAKKSRGELTDLSKIRRVLASTGGR